MRKESLQEITRNYKIPDFFFQTYRKHILCRVLAGTVLLIVSVFVSLFAAEYSRRSPVITGTICFLLLLGVINYKLGLKDLLFGKTWTGTICDIVYAPGARRTSIFSDLYFTDMMVKLFVIPSAGNTDEPIVIELGNYCKDATDSRQLRALGLNESHEGSFEKNPFYTKMPYQTGDHLLFLKGLRYPLRMEPDNYEMQNVVCPYCGDCFSIREPLCPRCRRKTIYGFPEKRREAE